VVAEKRARSVRRAGTEDSDFDSDIVALQNEDFREKMCTNSI